jgi:ketosteroid isomerase-like protein
MGTDDARSVIERNKSVVSTFFDRMSAGDVDGAFELVADGATWFSLSTREHADAAAIKPTIQRVFDSMLRAPIQQRVLIMTAEDDRVAAVTEGHAVTVDGINYDNMYHFLFVLADGLIAAIWEFNDTAHAGSVLRRGPGGEVGLAGEGA